MKSRKPNAVVIAGLLVLATAAFAQRGRHDAQARQRIEALRVWRITQELDLSEEQSQRFFPKLKQQRELRDGNRTARRAVVRELGIMVQAIDSSGNGSAESRTPRLRPLIDSLATLQESFTRADRRLDQELLAVLDLEQQARWFVFQDSFEREMRRMLQEMRGQRGRKR